jgi:hypothetical protein
MFHAKLVSYNVHIEVSIGKPIEEIMSFYVNFYELMWPKMMKKSIYLFKQQF